MTTTQITRNADLYDFATGIGQSTAAAARFLANPDSPAAIRLIAAVKAAYDRAQVRRIPTQSAVVAHAPTTDFLVCQDTKPETRPIWPGKYTIEHAAGHTTFQVKLQASDAEFAPGKMVIGYLTGKDNDGDYTDFAFVSPSNTLSVWKRFHSHTDLIARANILLDDPFADSVVWSKHCARCGDTLTVPLSVERGFGPTCWGKGSR